MLLLIQCKYRILEKHKPPMKKTGEATQVDNDTTFDKPHETEGLMDGEDKLTIDMEVDHSQVCTFFLSFGYMCID